MENTLQWIERSRLGDREAFARIVEQYQGLVSAATLNVVGNYTQSEDLAQETFLTAWKKLPELREPDKLASWLYGIARRVALRWAETQQCNPLHQAAELDAEAMSDRQSQADAEERRRREQSIELIWSTVKELPETLREPLLLYYRYSKSVADIAASLSLTEGAVHKRLFRGREMLKAEVEKQVESVLESTRPGEYFTVAVLAAIPVLAVTPEVFAATSAATSAGAAAKSSGGVPLLASIGAYLTSLAKAVFLPFTVFVGVVFGAWNGVRNSPTLRSRRFMLKAMIFQTMMGLSFFVSCVVYGRSSSLFMPMNGDSPMRTFIITSFYCIFVFIGLYCVVSSYVINRRWRKIVEEDKTQTVDLETLEQSGLSPRSLLQLSCYFIGATFIAVLATIFFTMFLIVQHGGHWWGYFNHISHIYTIQALVIPPFAVLFAMILFYYAAKRMVADEKSLEVWPSRIPNFLQVLTGEEKPKSGFRNRTNKWSDLLLVSIGLSMIQMAICANKLLILLPNFSETDAAGIFHWCCYVAFFAISFSAYLLFVLFFGGIPRKRYWGYIYLGTFLFIFNAVFVLLFEPWLYHYAVGSTIPRYHVNFLGFNLFWLSCFILSGVAGLWAFRKKQKPE